MPFFGQTVMAGQGGKGLTATPKTCATFRANKGV
jgi:hypothetical protein